MNEVVILCGGRGTRLGEYSTVTPKPMVEIGGIPIVVHIMRHYAKHGVNRFILATGHLSEVIHHYFANLNMQNGVSVDFGSGEILQMGNALGLAGRVECVFTGADSQTGSRLARLENFILGDHFFLTYGDGLSDIDLSSLIETHVNNEATVTVTAVQPLARFGSLDIEQLTGKVRSFKEKPMSEGKRINGGFFCCSKKFFKYLSVDEACVLEGKPLEQIARDGGLTAHLHDGFWQCMDTPRDKSYLESLWHSGEAPWSV